jgi:hypothetical protein
MKNADSCSRNMKNLNIPNILPISEIDTVPEILH